MPRPVAQTRPTPKPSALLLRWTSLASPLRLCVCARWGAAAVAVAADVAPDIAAAVAAFNAAATAAAVAHDDAAAADHDSGTACSDAAASGADDFGAAIADFLVAITHAVSPARGDRRERR